MKKRGSVGDHVMTLAWIILAAIVITAAFMFIFGKFTRSLFGDIGTQSEQGANANLVVLGDQVQKMIDSGKISDYAYNFPYYISSDFILVGFDKIWDDTKIVKQGGGLIRSESITKPAECIGKACLCLYKSKIGKDFADLTKDLPVRCVLFKEDVVFLGFANENTNVGAIKSVSNPKLSFDNFEYLILYGDEVNGEKLFYIEKQQINSKQYIFIGVQKKAIASFNQQKKE
jgi:hypothetical protein